MPFHLILLNKVDILDPLGRLKYYCTLDLAHVYHQIAMDPCDRRNTAFSNSISVDEVENYLILLKDEYSYYEYGMTNYFLKRLSYILTPLFII